ncbi:MAG: homoserine O-succinyltransferase [Treponema sp.]|nr:homoserine O-succinyltransferase [Treponema sp.]MBD5412540.1 homoserine O-succinyltransferase [Treponema sp.]MDE6245382.1 homoserine O-succinyltransferase [Treponemataceae bacterium]
MPIKIQSDLPACKILGQENIFVITEKRAQTQDIRPLKVAIVNLMPTREVTETQILRLLANTPLQIEISLVRMENHLYKHTGMDYLKKFYIPSSALFSQKFDGLIITGAPVEHLPFEKVDYWKELCEIMDYAKENVFSTLYVCWGAFAGLYHLHGIQKHQTENKLFGIFMNYRTTINDPLLRGLDDTFPIPQSRNATIYEKDLLPHQELTILAKSPDAGITIAKSNDNREIFMTGHLEYDTMTLADEYWRDIKKGLKINLPRNYFPNNNTSLPPSSYWRSTAHLLFSNWMNYYVYQETPYNFTT